MKLNNNEKTPRRQIKKKSIKGDGDNNKLKNNESFDKNNKISNEKEKSALHIKSDKNIKLSENTEHPRSRRKLKKDIKKLKTVKEKRTVRTIDHSVKDVVEKNTTKNNISDKTKTRSEMSRREINRRYREFAKKHADDFGRSVSETYKHICMTVIAIVFVAYLGFGFVNYSNKLLPGTIVEGIDCGNMSSKECIEAITEKIGNYSLVVKKNGDVIDVINSENVKLVPSSAMPNKVRELVQSQNKIKWFFRFFTKPEEIDLEGVASVDTSAYYNFMKTSKGYSLPATISSTQYSIIFTKGEYQVAAPTHGDQIDRSVYSEKVMKAITDLDNDFEISKNDCYVKIENSDVDKKVNYENACKKANKIINYGSLKLNVDGFSGDLAKEIIQDSLVIDSSFNPHINIKTIESAVNKVSEKYNTKGSVREFKTSVGNVVPVKGGDYGSSLDLDGVAELVEKALLKGGTEVAALKYTKNLMNNEQTGIGSTYIEVDLTNQYSWLYIDGKKVSETPCVTGMDDGIHETSEGVYMLKSKKKDAILIGDNYVNPVEYWMEIDGGIGLYDAVWFTKFGGDVYKTRGTYGGIALPSDKAKEFHKNTVEKMPVVCYTNTRLSERFQEEASTGVISGQYRPLTSEEKAMLENIKNGQPAEKDVIYDGVKSGNIEPEN